MHNSDEGGRASGDATSAIPQYVQTGGNPGGYVSSTGETNGGGWYWSAPAKFLGNQINCFGKNLQFDLRQSALNNQFSDDDVLITGSGITIACNLQNPLTTWIHYNVPLDTSMGWRINTITGPHATEINIKNVLTNITNIRIRGEYITGADKGDLDNVILPNFTLPVYLSYFTATTQNKRNHLEWSTGNEMNSGHFNVEYGSDGQSFETIGTVSAAFNSSSRHTYSWIHNVTTYGSSFYRLQMVDKDGAYKYSQVVKVMMNQKAVLNLIPNPTIGVVTITGLDANIDSHFQLLDFAGKVLREQKVTGNMQVINIRQYPSGIYFVRIISQNNIQQMKIIKQ